MTTTPRPGTGLLASLHAWATSPLHPSTVLAPVAATAGWVAAGRSIPVGLVALVAVVASSAAAAVRRRPARVVVDEPPVVMGSRR